MTTMELPIPSCSCGQPFDSESFMIQCDVCRVWYHGGCIGVKEFTATEVDKFHCPQCQEKHGPSLMKMKTNYHRHDYAEPLADTKPVQTGTLVFIRELKSRHFPRADDIVNHLRGQQLTVQYLQTNGFDIPVIVDSKDGLDMIVPPPNFSLYDVESYIGGDREMDVIDVAKQNNVRMTLREFVEYYNDPYRNRILNVISLEFTNTGLSPLVEAPYIARKLDWVNYVWPRDWPEDNELKKPEVQKYCLMGVKDSFTDFHIDFGGTSVWYHVLRGEKIFYLIKPTPANLHLYQQWMCSSTQSETFFGDQVDACYKCVVKQGQTMLIPTGWIHAVLTPVDSLVFGGNFLHSLNIPMQIQIYEMERKMKTPAKFQYPGFETIHWFAAKRLLKELKDLNVEEKKCPPHFLQGVKALLSILKQWNTDKDYSMISRGQIPETINSQKLLKDLSKEIRHADRFLMALNPPKPERESKRKKRKPFNRDFVEPKKSNLSTAVEERPPLKITLPKPPEPIAPIMLTTTTIKVLPPVLPQTLPMVSPDLLQTVSPVKPVKPMKSSKSVKSIKSAKSGKSTKSTKSTKSGKSGKSPKSPKSPKPIKPIKTIKTLSPKTPASPKKSGGNKTPGSSKPKRPPKKALLVESQTSVVTPGKQSPTVIRFKLGDKEVVRSTKGIGGVGGGGPNNIYGNFMLDQQVETRKELTWKQTTSVYDFHDGSNESDGGGFTIDEAPTKKKKSSTPRAQGAGAAITPKRPKKALLVENPSNAGPKNGIEELLKASAYTIGPGTTPQRMEVIPSITPAPSFVQPAPVSTGASPSTRDAIAGMLSFSAQCYSTTTPTTPAGVPGTPVTGAPKLSAKAKAPRPVVIAQREVDDEDDLLIENMDKVHQDDDFIYPALDVSDEDEFMFKSKGKREEDEAWNPKARVGPLLPKTNRPAREGAKKTSVEKGLEAAAKKRAKQPHAQSAQLDNDADYVVDDEDGEDDDDFVIRETERVVKKRLGTSKRIYKKKPSKKQLQQQFQQAAAALAAQPDTLALPFDPTAAMVPPVTPILSTPSAITAALESTPEQHEQLLSPQQPQPQQQPNVRHHVPYSSILTSPNRLKDVKAKLAAPIPVERKPKKGMKTAKQRLGKILKIHKMF